jgi:RHS repeat-associated protein
MASSNPYRYAGYRYDEAIGLYYLMARYYDPNIGRFITRDTFHGFETDPLSISQYAYTKNNPVMYIDPDGHNPIIWAVLRLLVTIGWKIGRDLVERGWDIAYPYVKRAISDSKNYILEGPGGGGRIVQVRNRKTGAVLFRLDYYPIKPGGPFILHYHTPPDINKHHVIW